MRLKVKKKVGQVRTSSRITSRAGKILHEEDQTEELKKQVTDGSHGMIRYVAGIKLSLAYNSATVEVGVELPMPMKPGNLRDAERAAKRVERMVDARMEEKAQDLQRLLRELA